MGQNISNLNETEQSMADRWGNAVASPNRLHSEELNKVVADYKRHTYFANNTVGDEVAEKMLFMQEEHASEFRSMREQAPVTMNGVIRDNASMDAEHKEEKQRMQSHFAQLFRNARGNTNRNRENQRQVASQSQ